MTRAALGFALALGSSAPVLAQQADAAPPQPGQQAANAAGTIEFVVGEVLLRNAKGEERAASKGTTIGAGDTIATSATGRAQIRFVDGGYVSLMPETEFSIREYSYDGRLDGSEASFFAIARGAMRAATGWIGRVNKSRYMITTPTATIGVRGTGGLIEVLADGTTKIVGTSGIWTLTNAAGTLAIPAGTAGIATPERSAAPRQTASGPVVAPAAARPLAQQPAARPVAAQDNTYVAGNDRTPASAVATDNSIVNSAPANVATNVPLTSAPPPAVSSPPPTVTTPPTVPPPAVGVSGPTITPLALGDGVYTLAVAYGYETRPAPGITGTAGDTVIAASSPVTFAGQEVTRAGPFTRTIVTGNDRTLEGGNNGLLAWGRWVGDVTDTSAGTTRSAGQQEGFHYVFGTPSPSLPTTNPGGQAFVPYTLLAATAPTFSQGSVPSGTLTAASMGVDFASRKVGVDMTAQFAGFAVNMQTAGGATDPSRSQVVFGANSTFAGALSGVTVTGSRPVSLCPGGCTGNVNGLFAGADGAQAGLVYQVVSTGGTGRVSGAAVFAR